MELTKKNLKTQNFLRKMYFSLKINGLILICYFQILKLLKKLPIKNSSKLRKKSIIWWNKSFGPFLDKFIAVDCYSDTLYKRGYNKHLIKNKKVIKFTKIFFSL